MAGIKELALLLKTQKSRANKMHCVHVVLWRGVPGPQYLLDIQIIPFWRRVFSLSRGCVLQNKGEERALLRVGGDRVHLVLSCLHLGASCLQGCLEKVAVCTTLGQLGTFGACGSYSPPCSGEAAPGLGPFGEK